MARARVYGYRYASIESLDGCDWKRGDIHASENKFFDEVIEREFEQQLFKGLDDEKKNVVALLLDGFDFLVIGNILGIKQFHMYEIKCELEKHFAFLNGNKPVSLRVKNKLSLMKNLIYFYCLVHPDESPAAIEKKWEKDPVLKEYKKPSSTLISAVCGKFQLEFISK